MRKFMCAVMLLIVMASDAYVFAGQIHDKIEKGLVEHIYLFLHEDSKGEVDLTDLAKKTVVGGIPLEKFLKNYGEEIRDIDNTFKSEYGQKHNRAKAYFEQTKNNEIACRNIIAVYSSYGVYHEPSDYQVVGGWYLHTFGRYGKEYDCKHNSFEGFKNHVYWINESDRAYREMISTPEIANENEVNSYVKEKITQFANKLEPYKEIYIAEQGKVRDVKTKEIQHQITLIEPKVEKIICEEVVGTKEVANIKLLTQKTRCKKYKKCKLIAANDGGENVWIGCACGHSMKVHKFVFKKGIDCSQEKKLLGIE